METNLPSLASIAQDILCILAAEPRVERVFNIGQEICYFDNKESMHTRNAQLEMIGKEFSWLLTPEQLEEDLEARIKAVAASLDKKYITNKEGNDIEEDPPERQHY
jgi:hypothetical protein